MAFAEINGINMHYELIGEPAASKMIVFSNSLGTDFRIWLPVFDELGDDVSVLFYDTRGHGLTATGRIPFTMDDLADDLIGLVEYLGIRKAIFCGLSMGGIVVQALYAKRPDLVKKLILCDTAPKMGDANIWNPRIEAVHRSGIASVSAAIMERWFTPGFHGEREAELAGYRTMLERQPADGYAAVCEAIRDADYTATAGSIAVPTLCIVGDQDGSSPPDVVRAAANLIPGASFEIIEDCGHIPCVEQPERLAALIEAFVKKK